MGVLKIDKNRDEVLIEALTLQEQVVSVSCRETGLKFVSKMIPGVNWGKGVFWLNYPRGQELFSLEKSLYVDGKFYATVRLEDKVLGLHFNFVRADEKGIMCRLPHSVYEINRRESYRQKIKDPQSITFKIPLADCSRVLIGDVQDISTGGLSFNVGIGVKSLITADRKFRNCPIKIGTETFLVNVTFKNLFCNEGKLKVGVSFDNPPASLISAISLYIGRNK